jgi:sec-independent protein translocase protein TatC
MRRFARRVRYGLLGTFLAFGTGAGLTWYFRVTIFNWLIAPAGGNLSPHAGLPIYTSPTEILSVTIRLSLTGGVVLAIPVLVLTIFYLVSPLISRHERRLVALFLPAILAAFLAGVSFAYFVMLPVGIAFLLHFGEGVAVPTIRISEYLNLVITMIFWLGIIFELPLAMMLLARLRLVSYQRFKRVRKFVPPVAIILSAIITPTFDIVNQLMVAIPIILLYEVGLALSWLAQPGKGRLVIRRIKALLVGILRRLAVVLVLVPSLLVGVIYVTALSFVFVWDGHLSTGTPSRGRARLDRAYGKLLTMIARVAKISRERTE